MEREKFGSRLGFILISAGCAIGLGNVWRFPYIVGKYGGAIFILIYFAFLILFGLPIMTMEFSVGRASGKSIVTAFNKLEPKGTKWHFMGWVGLIGNYLLMMFYTTITGWMVAYFLKTVSGGFSGMDSTAIQDFFDAFTGNPVKMLLYMVITVLIGFLICSLGLKNGVEKITKVMMLALLGIISVLAVYTVTLDGAREGLKYYLVPDISRIAQYDIGEVVFAALGQAFFTLSIGMGTMTVFGSYIGKERRLFGECITIASLDTCVAVVAGLIVIPSCFAYGIQPGEGPGLIFQTLPVVFSNMPGGRIWGSLFFLFMIFAALSTVIAVFENIISMTMDMWNVSRKKTCAVNVVLVTLLSVPCALGFNLLSFIEPLGAGTTILDLEDFVISNNILPLGSLVFVLFCTYNKKGWGWANFINEANTGKGIKFPRGVKVYIKYILPVILLLLWVQGIVTKFF